MFYVKNLPVLERVIRIGAGSAVAIYAVVGLGGVLSWTMVVTGIGLALTGVIGFCPACAMAGRRLQKQAKTRQTAT